MDLSPGELTMSPFWHTLGRPQTKSWVTQHERSNVREYDVSEKPSTECKIITDAQGMASNGAYHFPTRSDWARSCRHGSDLSCLGCSMQAIPPAFSSSACPSAMTLFPLSCLLFHSSWEASPTALPPHLHLQPRHFPELWTHKSSSLLDSCTIIFSLLLLLVCFI